MNYPRAHQQFVVGLGPEHRWSDCNERIRLSLEAKGLTSNEVTGN